MARVKKVKTGATECDLYDLCFKVDMHDNPRKTNKEYSKVVTGIIDGEEIDLNYCSSVYALVKNESIFPQIEKALFDNSIEYKAKYTHINNVRFYADYIITDKRYTHKMKETNDVINPQIRVQHSYNGLTKYKICFGYFRLVCSNGLTIPVKEMEKFNLVIVGKHTDLILNSFKKLNELLQYFVINAKLITSEITKKYELLNERIIEDPVKRIEAVLKANKINMVDNAKINTVNNIADRILVEANSTTLGYNGKISDFLIYNGINQYLNDNKLNIAVPEIRQEKDSKILEFMLETV